MYECDEIPNLDIDETDDEVYVGKVYASKEDCQISLAIYAIKGQFQFKWTLTKRDYFVLNCKDGQCDWRIMAKENPHTGNYVIKQAKLEHIFPVENMNSYRSMASTGIAAVSKSKFGYPLTAPPAMELQQMVLEELRVSASYMKCYRAIEKAGDEVRGTDDGSYLKLADYLHMLKLANPGTITAFGHSIVDTKIDHNIDDTKIGHSSADNKIGQLFLSLLH